MERSIDRSDRKKISFENFKASMRKKIKRFRTGFTSAFESFSMDNCSTSQSDSSGEEVIYLVYSCFNENNFVCYHIFICNVGKGEEET